MGRREESPYRFEIINDISILPIWMILDEMVGSGKDYIKKIPRLAACVPAPDGIISDK